MKRRWHHCMRQEIEYQMWVKQPMELALAQLEQDAAHFNIDEEELNRAIFEWVMDRIAAGPVPEWLVNGLNEKD